ncbi:MAG: dihydroneopterin aldolase [Ignavibacteriae bacterium]|nr:dihydroneopterin aldolase [Ignavibacteriota bacterium]
MPRHDIIRIKNATFYAYHGAISEEQNLGGKFEVDVDLRCDLSEAMESDSLKRTVNYEAVYSLIEKIVTSKKYYLIEALANSIANGILKEFSVIGHITVRVRKPHPSVKGVVDYVEAEVSHTRG